MDWAKPNRADTYPLCSVDFKSDTISESIQGGESKGDCFPFLALTTAFFKLSSPSFNFAESGMTAATPILDASLSASI